MRKQIGTVEIKRARIYPLDPEITDDVVKRTMVRRTSIVVEPGTYPVYNDGERRYWRMTGVIDNIETHVDNIDHGMFGVRFQDKRSDDDVIVYSPRYSSHEWRELLAWLHATPTPALVFDIKD